MRFGMSGPLDPDAEWAAVADGLRTTLEELWIAILESTAKEWAAKNKTGPKVGKHSKDPPVPLLSKKGYQGLTREMRFAARIIAKYAHILWRVKTEHQRRPGLVAGLRGEVYHVFHDVSDKNWVPGALARNKPWVSRAYTAVTNVLNVIGRWDAPGPAHTFYSSDLIRTPFGTCLDKLFDGLRANGFHPRHIAPAVVDALCDDGEVVGEIEDDDG
jgi:hypothetical protein